MLGLLFLAYALVWRRKFGRYLAGLIVMTVFLIFNTVLFRQYMIWTTPLVLLAACDSWDQGAPARAARFGEGLVP